ncbi:hypothetical protein ASPTUDRAFT_125111 [Aspergillus tubingensis CBS 134.48]|uniref:Uncharacterized protein n=1 Tax=Aspergillus tubingensis (strain CBS 134.48) TaxID=767770 RepID=A0A1L9N0L7_ASPTC|nr:hypothetical protein ASPTUDRAFT_125111 [Aspergillus tubingensis CBS 134.48]
MAPTAPVNLKPFVPEWVPPPVTKEKHNFAQLKYINLLVLDSEDLVLVKIIIRDDGFLFFKNHGVFLDQFALTQYLYNNISKKNEECFLFYPDIGLWSGYKYFY